MKLWGTQRKKIALPRCISHINILLDILNAVPRDVDYTRLHLIYFNLYSVTFVQQFLIECKRVCSADDVFQRCSFLLSSYRNLRSCTFDNILSMGNSCFFQLDLCNDFFNFVINSDHFKSISTIRQMLLFPLQLQGPFCFV